MTETSPLKRKYQYMTKEHPSLLRNGLELELTFYEKDEYAWETIKSFLEERGFYATEYNASNDTVIVDCYKLVTYKNIVKEGTQAMKDIRRLARDREHYEILNADITIKLY